jgi:hypothetical protein
MEDVAVHPLTGVLPADAERLAKVEAKARPNEVGGFDSRHSSRQKWPR